MLPSWPDSDFSPFRLPILRVALDVCASERGVGALNQHRQQRRHRRLHIADNALRDRITSSQMGRVNIDLHDLCLFRVKLPPGEVSAKHQQRIAVQQGMVAGLVAKHPGHSDVVRIVELEKVLCPRRMGDRRLQLVGDRENLLMRALAARSAVQHNILAFVENFCHLGEIGVVRPHDGPGDMDRVRDAIIHY